MITLRVVSVTLRGGGRGRFEFFDIYIFFSADYSSSRCTQIFKMASKMVAKRPKFINFSLVSYEAWYKCSFCVQNDPESDGCSLVCASKLVLD